jgi:hypothetical protein
MDLIAFVMPGAVEWMIIAAFLVAAALAARALWRAGGSK